MGCFRLSETQNREQSKLSRSIKNHSPRRQLEQGTKMSFWYFRSGESCSLRVKTSDSQFAFTCKTRKFKRKLYSQQNYAIQASARHQIMQSMSLEDGFYANL